MKIRDLLFGKKQAPVEASATDTSSPEILLHIWKKSLQEGIGEIGHAGISVDGQYSAVWPMMASFGPLQWIPLPAELSNSLADDEQMQSKGDEYLREFPPMSKLPTSKPADRVYKVTDKAALQVIADEVASMKDKVKQGDIGYQFYDRVSLITHFLCKENLLEIRTDPFSGALMRETYGFFPPPEARKVPEGVNCTGFVIKALNSGLKEEDKLPVNRVFPWRRSPDRLAEDVAARESVFMDITDEFRTHPVINHS